MESQTLTGPLLYLLIAWGVVTAVFLVLLLRRSLLASHEDDQIFLDAAQEHMAREQREIVAKINALSRPIMGTGILAGALLLVSDSPMVPEGIKTEESDKKVTANYVERHIHIGIDSLKQLINDGLTVRHLKF